MKLERCVGMAGFLSVWSHRARPRRPTPRRRVPRSTPRRFGTSSARPHGHDEPARQREARGGLRGAGARARRHPRADVRRRSASANVVARLSGNGRKRPLLIMGHTDTVNVDPPSGSTRRSARRATATTSTAAAPRRQGQRHGGADDDAAVETQPRGARSRRDLPRRGRRGGQHRSRYRVHAEQHYDAIDAEYCLAEGGSATRVEGEVRYAGVQTAGKFPKGMDLIAHGVAGHGSVPLESNPIARLARAINAVTQWQPPVVLNATTRAYFARLAEVSDGAAARRSRRAEHRSAVVAAADAWLRANDPTQSLDAADVDLAEYRSRRLPQQRDSVRGAARRSTFACGPARTPRHSALEIERLIGDPEVEVVFNGYGQRPPGVPAALDSAAFRGHRARGHGALRCARHPHDGNGADGHGVPGAKGMQCYGVGPAVDQEDGPLGFARAAIRSASVEQELYRFSALPLRRRRASRGRRFLAV